ncbi:uncharacterized protein GlcG (DUF336 family) [Psychrobacter sp. PL15]|uniref:heme-binding protein n=1 Tax=Psychrobacter sp. PL15 TaxID=3071719 RepID=UPI002DFD997B|nr:uncharacterized protein GlcG (DUF336 family) [Psychrobacter sp. PL15]
MIIIDTLEQISAVLKYHNAGVHIVRASYNKAYTTNSQKEELLVITNGITGGFIPADIRYSDETMLIMDGGEPIYIGDVVVGSIEVGGAHSSQDVRIAKASLETLN